MRKLGVMSVLVVGYLLVTVITAGPAAAEVMPTAVGAFTTVAENDRPQWKLRPLWK